MGYWIIVVLIALGGILVLLAAASIDADADGATDAPQDSSSRSGAKAGSHWRQTSGLPLLVPVELFTPRSWTQNGQFELGPEFTGASTSLRLVENSMLAGTAALIESTSSSLGDSVVIILAGADDFLAGQSLDAVLEHLDSLLDRLSDLPAMAVVGSIPDIVPALNDYMTGVSFSSISSTIAIWNQAVANLAGSYSAEFVDLSTVPVELLDTDGGVADLKVTLRPDQGKLMDALAPAICRAVARVRSFRADS